MKALKASGITVLIILALWLAPMLFLWTINSLAEAGGAVFYIEHTLRNYWVATVALAIIWSTSIDIGIEKEGEH